MIRDKRSMERFDLNLPAVIAFENETGEMSHQKVVAKNVCAGGSYCATGSTLPRGTEVKLDLIVSLEKINNLDVRKSHIAVSGRVIRSDKEGIAICFNKQYHISTIA